MPADCLGNIVTDTRHDSDVYVCTCVFVYLCIWWMFPPCYNEGEAALQSRLWILIVGFVCGSTEELKTRMSSDDFPTVIWETRDRQGERDTNIQRDEETKIQRQRERETKWQSDIERDNKRQRYKYTKRWRDRETKRDEERTIQKDKETKRQRDRGTERQREALRGGRLTLLTYKDTLGFRLFYSFRTGSRPCGPMWTRVDPCGPIWTCVDACGPVWTHVDLCGPVWTRVDPCGPMWTRMDPCGPMWTHLHPCGPMWTRVDALSNVRTDT